MRIELNLQTVFIIDKKNNMLIFLGTLVEGISLNQQELAKILSKIVSSAAKLDLSSFDKTTIENKHYFYGSFDKIIVIAQHSDDDAPPEDLLVQISKDFIGRYSELLDNYSNQDIPKFKSFLENLKVTVAKFIQKKPVVQKAEVPVAESSSIPEMPKTVEIGKEPIITPMKRDAYPEGIADYKRDEVLWNESEMVKNEYVAEFVEGMITQLQIFLSISLTHHYEVLIDFSEYPLKPKINIGEGLSKELGKSLDELLFFYKNWDTKIPPHIIEVIREFEAVLMKYKAKKKLSDTAEMPEAALPDLEPLPELPPLEEDEKPKETPIEPEDKGPTNEQEKAEE